MTTATDQAPWIRDALAPPPVRDEELVYQLAEALEDEILAYPGVKQAEARIRAGLNRVTALNERLADQLNLDDLVQVDFYCAVVRATLTAVLARSEGAVR